MRVPVLRTISYLTPLRSWSTLDSITPHHNHRHNGRGVLLFELLTFTMPFRATSTPTLLATVLRGSFALPSQLSSGGARDLVSKLLVSDPRQRLRIGDVMQHPWAATAISARAAGMPQPPRLTEPMPKRPTVTRGDGASPQSRYSSQSPTGEDRSEDAAAQGKHTDGHAPLPVEHVQQRQQKRPQLWRRQSRSNVDTTALAKLAHRAKASRGQQYWFTGVISEPVSNRALAGGVLPRRALAVWSHPRQLRRSCLHSYAHLMTLPKA